MSTVIIDYKAGNLFNLKNALDYIGIQSRIVSEASEVEKAERILFPGVGAFGAAISNMRHSGMEACLRQKIKEGTPFLGICVGLQLLFETGEEGGHHEGLGLLKGKVQRFQHQLKIPHMGWNQVESTQDDPLFKDIPKQSYFYFVHSYHVHPQQSKTTIAQTDYGHPFTAAVREDNVWGVQFHPEKSQEVGLQLLRNFCSF